MHTDGKDNGAGRLWARGARLLLSNLGEGGGGHCELATGMLRPLGDRGVADECVSFWETGRASFSSPQVLQVLPREVDDARSGATQPHRDTRQRCFL